MDSAAREQILYEVASHWFPWENCELIFLPPVIDE